MKTCMKDTGGRRGGGGGGAIVIGFWYVSFYTDYPNLDNLFELCPFMQQLNHMKITLTVFS